jgi:diguanylate cyclase (GGDEF)-like protein
MMDEQRKKQLRPVVQNLIITSLITLFFLAVVFIYYNSVYDKTRENILLNAEMNAVRAANTIDRHLYTGMDAIQLTGYTLDNMIRDKRPQEDIQDYLEDQSFATAIVVEMQSNGIYGFINGEYLDGIRWVPDEDYVPTERPWYIEARALSGRVAIIDPYLDAQTGSMIITFAKTLCDAKSVVAIDVSLAQLQELTEEIAAQGSSDIEIILDRNYQVISHSDRNEVGKSYAREDGSFGGCLAAEMRSRVADNNRFSLRYDNKEYIVYAMTIENDWICVSVTDATKSLDRLRIPLALTVLAAILIIGSLFFLMIRSIRKDINAEKMKQLAARQTEIAYRDQMTGLKNRRAYAETVEGMAGELPEKLCVLVLDVNGLKEMNDTRGHEAGDELIIAAATCIRGAFPDCDAVFRIGGDEFCVFLTDPERDPEECVRQMEASAAAWKGRFVNGFTIACGMARAGGGKDIHALIQEADQAMYECKSRYYGQPGADRRRRG